MANGYTNCEQGVGGVHIGSFIVDAIYGGPLFIDYRICLLMLAIPICNWPIYHIIIKFSQSGTWYPLETSSKLYIYKCFSPHILILSLAFHLFMTETTHSNTSEESFCL